MFMFSVVPEKAEHFTVLEWNIRSFNARLFHKLNDRGESL